MGEQAERTAPIFQVLIQAAGAEPEMAELLERFEDQRLAAATRIATEVRARGGLPPGRSFDDARDVIWMCSAPEISTMLVGKRGWTTPGTSTGPATPSPSS